MQIVYKNVDSVNIVAESVAELHLCVINWRVSERFAVCNGVVDLSLTLSARIRTPEPAIIPCRTMHGKHYIPHKIHVQPPCASPSVRRSPLYTNHRTVQPGSVPFRCVFSLRGTLGGAEALDAQGRCVSRAVGLLTFVEPLYTSWCRCG